MEEVGDSKEMEKEKDEMNELLDFDDDDDGASIDSYDSAFEMVTKKDHGLNVDTETDYAMEIAELERLLKSAETEEKRRTLVTAKESLEKKKELANNLRINTPSSPRPGGDNSSSTSGMNGATPRGRSVLGISPTNSSTPKKTKLFEAAPVQRPTSARPRSARQRSISLKAIPEDGIYNRRAFKRQNSSRRPSASSTSLPVTGEHKSSPINAGANLGLGLVHEEALQFASGDSTRTQPGSPTEGEVCELPRTIFSEVWATCIDFRHPPDHALSSDRRRFWLSTGSFPQSLSCRTNQCLTIYKVTVSAVNVKQLALHIEESNSVYIEAGAGGHNSPNGSRVSSVVTLPPPHRHLTPTGEVRRKWEAFSHTFEVGAPGQGRKALGFRLYVESAYHDFAAIQSLQILGMVGESKPSS
mmetsp:Transcript_13686/g.18015  ORF Transcript_13686/g.18015 Transcript_13686/m.18015 type:complete len:414 (+) Transcript_13686:280-1521(+)|eukprot:CAMPEP_0117733806 /NCGR_PEP_ID=MMETSP0947-20121206/286_1 /TAXON_ID=44440 /ORGANISM="Chattonella subsalsa, Strain CCMP2191" /LENGTH=413 /DNA_ID=CAMNT_0005548441 /DNA_START=247 /DNA_END=1488 /DNA_ORIENTATION=-